MLYIGKLVRVSLQAGSNTDDVIYIGTWSRIPSYRIAGNFCGVNFRRLLTGAVNCAAEKTFADCSLVLSFPIHFVWRRRKS